MIGKALARRNERWRCFRHIRLQGFDLSGSGLRTVCISTRGGDETATIISSLLGVEGLRYW
jgi:hypothetical protein